MDGPQQQQQQEASPHPTAALFLVAFKGAALAWYILCGWLPLDFVGNFCIITFLLVCDFWTVKNVSGRLLVGLRWWNEVSESGGSDWKFESLGEGGRRVHAGDARAFWAVTYAAPAVWGALAVVALMKFNLEYLLVVVIALVLSGANLAGYLKCSRAAQAQLRGYAQGVTRGLIAQGLRSYFGGGGGGGGAT